MTAFLTTCIRQGATQSDTLKLQSTSLDSDNDSVENEHVENQCKSGRDMSVEEINHYRNQHRIHVSGEEIPPPITQFQDLSEIGAKPFLMNAVLSCKFPQPTPIQAQAWPILGAGRDLIGIASTGSGKTAAFLIPLIARLKVPMKVGVRAIIILPTKELALQTFRELKRFCGNKPFRACVLAQSHAKKSLDGELSKEKYDVLITTPLRLVHILNAGSLPLEQVQTLILDEADKLFELGFLPQINEVLEALPKDQRIQKVFFSATMPPSAEDMTRMIMRESLRVTIGARNSTADTIDQELMFVGNENGKLLAIRQMLAKGLEPPVLIFLQSRDRAQELFRELIYSGINVDVMHSDRTPAQRNAIVTNFRLGKIWVLICTDVMARGIDFKNVHCVINFDFPQSITQYIHRIGRTGRAGKKGRAVTLFTEDDVDMLRSIATLMRDSGCFVPDWMLQLKKVSKKVRKERSIHPSRRNHIDTTSKWEIEKSKKERMYKAGTKAKQKHMAEQAEKEIEKMRAEVGDEAGDVDSARQRVEDGKEFHAMASPPMQKRKRPVEPSSGQQSHSDRSASAKAKKKKQLAKSTL
jgi:ATP-dependent RNA helicase DDX52/ROK1